ncbi:uncharacterized protein LOC126910463 [Daktulosphaira vitifoliae]|uniref:uncharacterized protein LOC126910463 n=1 Tax=Daktulosphaira vitifoliae TaxID=58002 RepID=UPI0021AA75FF|nr:uncharacterized protein LOC126910463 [Daktulosphaira vitifoliae]
MFKRHFVFSLCIFGLISQILLLSNGTNNEDFKKYTINVLEYIRLQTGWYSMQKLQITQGTFVLNYKNIVSEVIDESNYIVKLNYIINFINCEYSNVLQIFDVMLSFIINKCQSELEENRQIQFQYCTERLIDIVKNSTIMFMKLLGATAFLKQFDLRIINKFLINPRVIDNEIELFYNYADKINRPEFFNENSIIDVFEDIKGFHKTIAEPIILQLYKINEVCGSNYKNDIPNVLKTIYDVKNSNEQINDSGEYVNIIYNKLNVLYRKVIDNYYKNLGFGELIGTNSFSYEPQKLNEYSIKYVIKLINTLLSYSGWQSYNNITTRNRFTKGIYVNIQHLICPGKSLNYLSIRLCIPQILRCRYIEIVHTFNVALGAILRVCDKEYENGCAAILFKILEKAELMFNNMLFALVTLRHISNTNTKQRLINTSIDNLVESIIKFICKLRSKYYPGMFVSSQGVIAIKSFFNDIAQEREENINKKIHIARRKHMCFCKMPSELIDEISFMLKIQNQILISNSLDNKNLEKFMCDFLSSFCDEVQINDYEKLGFDSLLS